MVFALSATPAIAADAVSLARRHGAAPPRVAATGQTTRLQGVRFLGTVTVRDLAARAAAAAADKTTASAPRKPTINPKLGFMRRRPGADAPAAVRRQIAPPPNVGVQSVQASAPPSGKDGRASSTVPVGYAPTRGFVGLSTIDNATELGYPSQGLAANNRVVAEIINQAVNFYDAASLNPHFAAPIPSSALFLDGNLFLDDPQVFFDPTLFSAADRTAASKGRWIFTADSNDFSAPGAPQNLAIAVSRTSDPFGAYNVYQVHAYTADVVGCGGVDCLIDAAKGGYDANGFYISVNLYNRTTTGNFAAAATFALSKAQLRDNTLTGVQRILYPGDFLVQPSAPAPGQPYYGQAGGTEFLLEARGAYASGPGFDNVIRLWALTNTQSLDSTGHISAAAIDIAASAAGAYAGVTNSFAEPNAPGRQCAAMSKPAPRLDGGSGGFQATIQYAAKKLYGVLTSANSGGGNYLVWYAIAPSVSQTGVPSGAIRNLGSIVPPAGYSIQYPSIALAKSSHGVIGFSIANPNASMLGSFPSTGFIKFGGTNVAGNLIVSGLGVAADDNYFGCVFNTDYWGVYGAATVDAATSASAHPLFYTANEIIAVPYTRINPAMSTNWSTYVTQTQ